MARCGSDRLHHIGIGRTHAEPPSCSSCTTATSVSWPPSPANCYARLAGIQSGETVLVTGASGGVGLALAQLAAARDATVTAVTSGTKGEAIRVAGATEVVSLDRRRLYLHNLRLVGSSMHTRAHFAQLVQAARDGTVTPRVAARYTLTDIHHAQQEFLTHKHIGKIVINITAASSKPSAS